MSVDLPPPAQDAALPLRESYIPCVDLEPGMVLGRSISITARGLLSFSLGAGTCLTEDSIHQILAHHAECVCIATPDSRSPEQRAAEIAQQEMRLQEIFQHADDAPATQALLAALRHYRSR